MNFGLQGKVALVTGAGIGSATARLLAQQGVAIEFNDLDAGVDRAKPKLGGLDFVVNVAGSGTRQPLQTHTPENWHAIIDLNLTGPFNPVKAAVPVLRRRGGGAVVTVGSLAELRMFVRNSMSYTTAKAGVLGLTRRAAYKFGRNNISVNAALPGPELTPQIKTKISPQKLACVSTKLPLGRWIQSEEVAAPILFCCSPTASACTGTHVLIDRGLHVGATSSREECDRTRDLAAMKARSSIPKELRCPRT